MFSEDDRMWNGWQFNAANTQANDGVRSVRICAGYKVEANYGRGWYPVSEDSNVNIRKVANELLQRNAGKLTVQEPVKQPSKPGLWTRLYTRLLSGA